MSSADERCVLEEEWFALVKEKDINFRQQLEEENEEAKRMQMKELFHLLESLRTFSFDKPNEVILKRNLTKMYNQIGRYCQRNKIDLKVEQNNEADKLVNTQTVDSIATPKLVQMPIPPPPPPPPVLTSRTLNVVSQPKVSENEQRRVATKTATLGTPRNHSNEELLRSIRERCRSELKSTPFKRSPGGTPLKRPRRMSETHTSDLIELALKRKFQKVVIRSPKENDSPRSVTSPGNF